MKYISLFSGIEAASCAWKNLGWEPVAFSEIEPFPCEILQKHFPDVPNLGDITQIDWSEFCGTVDLVVGGSPCQSFSISGGRESLDGESRLMYEYIRAVREIRPQWFVWENVPGVLNTKDNAFGQLLYELSQCGYDLSWRVLDAQFFGVAQRRRRVFLVGHLGGGGASAAVLFELESLRGYPQSSKEKREELAKAARRGADEQDFSPLNGPNCVGFAQNTRDEIRIVGDGTLAGALAASPGMKQQTYIASIQGDGQTSLNTQGQGIKTDGTSFTLTTVDRHSVICVSSDAQNASVDENLAPTLLARGGCYLATDKTSSEVSAPATSKESEHNSSAKEKS